MPVFGDVVTQVLQLLEIGVAVVGAVAILIRRLVVAVDGVQGGEQAGECGLRSTEQGGVVIAGSLHGDNQSGKALSWQQ